MAVSFHGFKSIVENSSDALLLIGTQGNILYGSASTAKIFGYQPEDLLGLNCLDLIHPEDRDRSSRALQEVLFKPPGCLQWDARFRHEDGNYFWVESTVSKLLFEFDVQAIVVQQRDIDARKVAEAERQQQIEELASSNLRLEKFAHTAAHDLREPLRTISAFTHILVQKTQMDANTMEMAQFILDAVARMSTLVDDLLSFANTGIHGPSQRVELRQAVAQALQNLAFAFEENGTVTVDPLPVVWGNEMDLVRLFQNLIGNAVKYRGCGPAELHVTAEQRGSDWVIRVKDNGRGIAPENQAKVFMPFVRLASQHIPGTGLGLAVCKNIVEGFGGRIWVESELGAGSTFCFTIAAEESTASAAG